MSVVAAFILPHPPLAVDSVGRGKENEIPQTINSYHQAAKAIDSLNPETLIVISPHAPAYADYIHISPGGGANGDFGEFGAKEAAVSVKYDAELVSEIEYTARNAGVHAGTLGGSKSGLDHGTMVPLWFINKYCKDYKTVRVSLSGLPPEEHYRLGKCIAEAVNKTGRRVVVIASGDLSHKTNAPGAKGVECREFDKKITDIMKTADFTEFLMLSESERSSAAECGVGSFVILAGILNKAELRTEFLSYEAPFGVGYGACAYYVKGVDEEKDYLASYNKRQEEKIALERKNEDAYVKLARMCVETYVNTGKNFTDFSEFSAEIADKKAGVFVSVKKRGALRGCIGTIFPVCGNIGAEIAQNAVSACAHDLRFDPVSPEELPMLSYSVDVLSEPEKTHKTLLLEMLDPQRYGVIVKMDGRRGVLLPALEGVDTIEEQLSIALKKAGIRASEDFDVERFTVERHVAR